MTQTRDRIEEHLISALDRADAAGQALAHRAPEIRDSLAQRAPEIRDAVIGHLPDAVATHLPHSAPKRTGSRWKKTGLIAAVAGGVALVLVAWRRHTTTPPARVPSAPEGTTGPVGVPDLTDAVRPDVTDLDATSTVDPLVPDDLADPRIHGPVSGQPLR